MNSLRQNNTLFADICVQAHTRTSVAYCIYPGMRCGAIGGRKRKDASWIGIAWIGVRQKDQYIYLPLRLTHRQAGELDYSLRARNWPFSYIMALSLKSRSILTLAEKSVHRFFPLISAFVDTLQFTAASSATRPHHGYRCRCRRFIDQKT